MQPGLPGLWVGRHAGWVGLVALQRAQKGVDRDTRRSVIRRWLWVPSQTAGTAPPRGALPKQPSIIIMIIILYPDLLKYAPLRGCCRSSTGRSSAERERRRNRRGTYRRPWTTSHRRAARALGRRTARVAAALLGRWSSETTSRPAPPRAPCKQQRRQRGGQQRISPHHARATSW